MKSHELDDLTDEQRAKATEYAPKWIRSRPNDECESYAERVAIDFAKALLTAASENARHREDARIAAGSCLISIDEMPPGSNMRRVVLANRMWRYERDTLRAEIDDLANEVAILDQEAIEAAADYMTVSQSEARAVQECVKLRRERDVYQRISETQDGQMTAQADRLDAQDRELAELRLMVSDLEAKLDDAHYEQCVHYGLE